MSYALLSHFYPGLTPVVIGEMTVYQFNKYLDNVGKVHNLFHGDGDIKEEVNIGEVIAAAKARGNKGPTIPK